MEVMIAIVLLAFIMITVISITENSQNSKERTNRLNRDNLQIETALSRIEWDLTQIFSPLYFAQRFAGKIDPAAGNTPLDLFAYKFRHPRFNGVSMDGQPLPIIKTNEDNDIIFFTSSNRRKLQNSKQSHFMWVSYKLKNHDVTEDETGSSINNSLTTAAPTANVKDLVRYMDNGDIYKAEEWDFEKIKPTVLLEKVEELKFEFWNTSTKKWDTNINTVPQGNQLLRGLRVTLEWYDSQGVKRTIAKILRPYWPLVVPQDNAAAPTTTAGANGATTTTGANGGTNGSTTGTTSGGIPFGGTTGGSF